MLELVGTEDVSSTVSLGVGQTLFLASAHETREGVHVSSSRESGDPNLAARESREARELARNRGVRWFDLLEKGPDVLEFDLLEIDLVLVVEVLSLELDSAHVDEGMLGLAFLLCSASPQKKIQARHDSRPSSAP